MKEIKTIMDLSELPDPLKLVKLDLYDKVFTLVQSNYYFSLLFGIDYDVGQKAKEELFNKGALIKIHSEKDKKPTFYPAPPTFIFLEDKISPKMKIRYKAEIEHLEEVYYQMFCNIKDSFLKQKTLFIKGKGLYVNGLMFFLLKRYMKKEATLMFRHLDINSYKHDELLLGANLMKKINVIMPYAEHISKMKAFKRIITVAPQLLGRERIITIDKSFVINFFTLFDARGNHIITGYITSDKEAVKDINEKIKYINSGKDV